MEGTFSQSKNASAAGICYKVLFGRGVRIGIAGRPGSTPAVAWGGSYVPMQCAGVRPMPTRLQSR